MSSKTVDENYKRLRAELDDLLSKDKRLTAIADKIAKGAADFSDTARYTQIVSKHMSDVIKRNIGELKQPMAKEMVCKELLRDHYDLINGVFGEVQVSVDEKLGVHLDVKKPAYPAERVDKWAHSLEDPTVEQSVIERRAASGSENIGNSIHDDCIDVNAELRDQAGLDCYLTRDAGGGCCPWCQALEGRYNYADAPDDIFRRHDNCTCTVTYECGRKRQQVWSKQNWSNDKEREYLQQLDAAKAAKREELRAKGMNVTDVRLSKKELNTLRERVAASEAAKPITLTQEQAQAINEQSKPVVHTPAEAKELEQKALGQEVVTPVDVNSQSVENQLADWETQNYTNDTEKGLLIMPDGSTKEFGGIDHHVTGKEEDIKLMNGSVFTHNHPTDNTFSENDIVTGLIKGNLKEMRAVTSTGDVHILSNNGASIEERRKFYADYHQVRTKASNIADSKIRKGEAINKDEYVKGRLETFMSEHAEKYHLSYTKTRIDAEDNIHSIKGKKDKFEPSVNMDCVSGSKPITERLQKELSNEYDEFVKTFGELDNVRIVTAVPYQKNGVWGSYNDNSNELFLFGIGGENGRNIMEKTAKEMYKSGYWSTKSPYHAFRHELGHAWQEKAAKQDLLYDKKIERISKIHDDVNDNINKALTENSESDIIKLRKSFLSDYGLDPDNDIDEFISECIAEYCNGSPRDTSLSVINILFAKEL